jgi:hypothetical protein
MLDPSWEGRSTEYSSFFALALGVEGICTIHFSSGLGTRARELRRNVTTGECTTSSAPLSGSKTLLS